MTAEIIQLGSYFRATVPGLLGLHSAVLPTRDAAERYVAAIEQVNMAEGRSTVVGAAYGAELPSDVEPALPYRVLP